MVQPDDMFSTEQALLDPAKVYPRASWLRHVQSEVFTIRLRDGRAAEVLDGPNGTPWLEMPELIVPRGIRSGASADLR